MLIQPTIFYPFPQIKNTKIFRNLDITFMSNLNEQLSSTLSCTQRYPRSVDGTPLLFPRGKKIKAIFFLILPTWSPDNSMWTPFVLKSIHSEQDRRGHWDLVLTCPCTVSLKSLNRMEWVNRGNASHNSILPHPAQKQVPGNLHPALGTVSPVFTQLSANPQEPGLPGLSLDWGRVE